MVVKIDQRQKPRCADICSGPVRHSSGGEIDSRFWLVVDGVETKLVAPSEIGHQRDVGIGNWRQQEIIGRCAKVFATSSRRPRQVVGDMRPCAGDEVPSTKVDSLILLLHQPSQGLSVAL